MKFAVFGAGGVPELEDQTGAMGRMGCEVGVVPTPTSDFIRAALLPMELKAPGRMPTDGDSRS